MKELLLLVVNGGGVGAVFAMIAMSLNVIYGATSILNFAQGYFVVLAALLASHWMSMTSSTGALWVLGVVAIALATGAGMGLQGFLTLIPLRSSSEQHSWLVTTLAAATIIGGIILMIQGPEAILVGSPFGQFTAFGVKTSYLYPLAMLCAVALFWLLSAFGRRSVTGLAMQALRQDQEASQAAAVPVRRLQMLAFMLSGCIIGFVGYVFGPVLAPSDSQGVELVLNGFTAAVVGGIGNMRGALIAGPAIGAVTVGTNLWIGGDYQRAIVLGVLIVILLVRPEGLFGRVTARRV